MWAALDGPRRDDVAVKRALLRSDAALWASAPPVCAGAEVS